MTNPEPTIQVKVDPANPGQFFACCGLLELADRMWKGAEGWFENGTFHVATVDRKKRDLLTLLEPLVSCSALTAREQIHVDAQGEDARGNDDSKPKADPVILGPPIGMCLSWWLRADGSENLFKTWAANATSQQMFKKWREPLRELFPAIGANPDGLLEASSRVQGSYGFDSLLGWDALEVGFSLNAHSQWKKVPTRPAVELLGAIGLQTFSPDLEERRWRVSYAIWGVPLLPSVARAAAVAAIPTAEITRYRAAFVSRGTFKGLDFATCIREGDSSE